MKNEMKPFIPSDNLGKWARSSVHKARTSDHCRRDFILFTLNCQNSRSRIRWFLGVTLLIFVAWTDYSFRIQKCRQQKSMLARFSS
ncbi:hypothetical protein BDV38DRAFT_249788 [Aspergillus pseudotamarii]|uniref:Uncharacterized protein n=1 Tax=Aspergillus pseudotamarii TaxID=132259 RepID=A0A5N6SRA1_ASPPS|nr:uncharacterized protein BDV38DRAFT_249788 [Aspergillus pseudotamarii]KAE8136290.1 hypothetical protein BDV38DRAFT_249788 [Aspergillus pseudotamarii]